MPSQEGSVAEGSWGQSFHAAVGKESFRPVYMLVIGWYTAPAENPATQPTGGLMQIWTEHGFQGLNSEDIFVYDINQWEFMFLNEFKKDVIGVDILLVEQGRHSTPSNTYTRPTIMQPWMVLTTHDISSVAPLLESYPIMSMPNGHGVDFIYHEGRQSTDAVSVSASDADDVITRRFGRGTPAGKRCVILGGYRDKDDNILPLNYWSVLYTGKVQKAAFKAGVYSFSLSNEIDDRLNKTLYGQLEDFSVDGTAKATSTINSSDTTITLDDDTNMYNIPGDGDGYKDVATDRYAGLFFRIKNTASGDVEMALVDELTTGTTYEVVRGRLGTTAHHGLATVNQEIRLMMSIQDNPINVLLWLLMTTTDEVGGANAYNMMIGAFADSPLGLGYPESDIDFTTFEAIRDDFFPNDIWRVDFYKRTRMKGWIEKHIMKVLGLHLYTNKGGKLSLGLLKAPVPGIESLTITEDHIIGAPELQISTDEVINNVTVKYDYDVVEDSWGNTTQLINADSISANDVERFTTIEAKGIDSYYSGETRALIVAHRKSQYFASVNPIIPTSVLFNVGSYIEPGSTHVLNHTKLPSISEGKVGFNGGVWCAAKKIDWERGVIQLEWLPILFAAGRKGLISPARLDGIDWADADADDKLKYAAWSDTNNLMSDGSKGYVIY